MTLPIVHRPAAQSEYEGSIRWYEEQRPGLGYEFEAEVQAALDAVASHPNRYPVAARDIRQAPVDRFPFSIFYRIRSGRIVVVSVFHHARDPAEWQGRA